MNSGGVDLTFFLMMGAIFAIFYGLVIRPQQKQQREREAFLKTAAKGDEVVTQGGIHGRVSAVENDVLEVEVARVRGEKVRLRVSLSKVDQLTKAGKTNSNDKGDES
jgi:preprotein translocase subunit YajC